MFGVTDVGSGLLKIYFQGFPMSAIPPHRTPQRFFIFGNGSLKTNIELEK